MLNLAALVVSLAVWSSSFAVAAVGPSPRQIKNLVTFGDSYTDVVSKDILYTVLKALF